MKSYQVNSYKEAAWVASKDVENWSEEERRQLGLIAVNHELIDQLTFCRQFDLDTKTKRFVKIANSENQQSFVLEGEVYLFHSSTHGIHIEKLAPGPLAQYSNEQLVSELCKR